MRVFAFNPEVPNLRPGVVVHAGEEQYKVRSVRMANKEWLLKLEDVHRREDAERLRGLLLEVPDETIEPEPDAVFVHDLIGIDVLTDTGEHLGTITDVLQPGANDVYVVSGPRGEVLIPAIGDVVQELDPEGRRLVITPLPGLLNESL